MFYSTLSLTSTSMATAVAAKTLGKHPYVLRSLAAASSRFFSSASPGSDPLHLFQKECAGRNLCSDHGARRPGAHWTVNLAVTPSSLQQPPLLKTVHVERASTSGLDFCCKVASGMGQQLLKAPVSMVFQQGKYIPGERTEQWRAEGICIGLELSEVVNLLPPSMIASMVASHRLAIEKQVGATNGAATTAAATTEDRSVLENTSHYTEVLQTAQREWAEHALDVEELQKSVAAFRFVPLRMEYTTGSPDAVAWDRWEWQRESTENDDDQAWAKEWMPPLRLVPH